MRPDKARASSTMKAPDECSWHALYAGKGKGDKGKGKARACLCGEILAEGKGKNKDGSPGPGMGGGRSVNQGAPSPQNPQSPQGPPAQSSQTLVFEQLQSFRPVGYQQNTPEA